MELRIQFDEKTLRLYASRNASHVCKIYWWHNGISFPGPDWEDFGPTILGWWLVAAKRLLQGSRTEQFLFMDGSYELQVQRQNGLLSISSPDLNTEWVVPLDEFITELVRATEYASRELRRLRMAQRERESLEKGLDDLRLLLQRR
jgi:hypothetical protein